MGSGWGIDGIKRGWDHDGLEDEVRRIGSG
jgi:hypothetical protein